MVGLFFFKKKRKLSPARSARCAACALGSGLRLRDEDVDWSRCHVQLSVHTRVQRGPGGLHFTFHFRAGLSGAGGGPGAGCGGGFPLSCSSLTHRDESDQKVPTKHYRRRRTKIEISFILTPPGPLWFFTDPQGPGPCFHSTGESSIRTLGETS